MQLSFVRSTLSVKPTLFREVYFFREVHSFHEVDSLPRDILFLSSCLSSMRSTLSLKPAKILRRNKLRVGRGAEATILTKHIKPSQLYTSKSHHSSRVLLDCKGNSYKFCSLHGNECGDNDVAIMTGSCCFVKIEKEGFVTQFFNKIYNEPSIP